MTGENVSDVVRDALERLREPIAGTLERGHWSELAELLQARANTLGNRRDRSGSRLTRERIERELERVRAMRDVCDEAATRSRAQPAPVSQREYGEAQRGR